MTKLLFLLIIQFALVTTIANAAPKPKLCMDTIPQGDKFYELCLKCEKNVKYCTGDLRDRMRELTRRELGVDK
jgi:hypothetical protein